MRRSRRLLISAVLMAVLILPASTVSAATTITYQLSGTAAATLWPEVSFSGAAKAKLRKESGSWSATFSQDLFAILGGTFTLASRARTFEGAIAGGTFGPGVGDCARTTIPVHGAVAGGGSFDVTLTRVGSLVNGSCVVSSSTVLGTATLIYP